MRVESCLFFFLTSVSQINVKSSQFFFSLFFEVLSPHKFIFRFQTISASSFGLSLLKFSLSYCSFKSAGLVQYYRTR